MNGRLYPILDLDLVHAKNLRPLDILDGWLEAGVRIVQLRAKRGKSAECLSLADEIVRRCRVAGARFIMNDRADLALMAGADGVHVGQDDLSAAAVRGLVGPTAWVGLSTHTVDQVEAGCRAPVSYLAIGPVFETVTKARPDACVGLGGVARAAERAGRAGLPVVAIGGITLAAARSVLSAGADSVAVISDLLVGDPAERVRQYLETLE